jgi:hypothetical protein
MTITWHSWFGSYRFPWMEAKLINELITTEEKGSILKIVLNSTNLLTADEKHLPSLTNFISSTESSYPISLNVVCKLSKDFNYGTPILKWRLLYLIFNRRQEGSGDVMSIKLFVETIQRMTMIANNPNAVDDVFIYAIDILEALHDKFRRRNILIALPDITPAVVTRIGMISKNNVAFTGERHLVQRT